MAADGVGFGKAIAERRLGEREFLPQPLDMADRSRRTAGRDVVQGLQILNVPIGLGQ
jgi:hypothetical protein